MEQIYTIPINEAFEEASSAETAVCPLCLIFNRFEREELELILGASMMEPDVRIKTNKLGFCRDHFVKMLEGGRKLPIALMLESHLDEVSDRMKPSRLLPAFSAKGRAEDLSKISEMCYVCARVGSKFEKVLENAVYMWSTDASFRRLFADQSGFCIPHYSALVGTASKRLKSNEFSIFSKTAFSIEEKYMCRIKENVTAFAKKFDYRYADEPLGEAKDAVEKAICALTGY